MGQVRIARWDNSFPAIGPAARVPQYDVVHGHPEAGTLPKPRQQMLADIPRPNFPGPEADKSS